MTAQLNSRIPLFAAVMAVMHLPFIQQAFHIDDANFLILADGALADPWRPHDVIINWSGVPERAFDVLSNPPGVAYILAAVKAAGGAEISSHLAIFPFTCLASWGIWRLARRLCPCPQLPTLLFVLSPAVVISAHLVMPDVPLLALYLAGLALAIEGVDEGDGRRAVLGALLLGGAAMFRYSGLTGGPLLLLYIGLHRRSTPLSAGQFAGVTLAWAAVPAAWALHDLHAYGQWHFWHMIAFQQAEGDGMGMGRKLLAQLIYTGGVAVVPLLPLWIGMHRSALRAIPWRGLGIAAPMIAGWALWRARGGSGFLEGLHGGAFLLMAAFLWAACLSTVSPQAFLRATRGHGGKEADATFLLLWAVGILVFNLFLRFVAARYLLLGLAPLLLLAFGGAALRPTLLMRRALIGTTAAIALTLAASDALTAQAYRAVAHQQLADLPAFSFAGHWGLQHYLAAAGGAPISAEGPSPDVGALIVRAQAPWPQDIPGGERPRHALKGAWLFEHLIPLKTLSTYPPACFHANAIAQGWRPSPAGTALAGAEEWERIDTGPPLLKAYQRRQSPHLPLSAIPPTQGQASWLPWAFSPENAIDTVELWQAGGGQ